MEKFNALKALIITTEEDAFKFYTNGNGAAGTRVRKAMMEVKRLAQEIRNEVTEVKHKSKA